MKRWGVLIGTPHLYFKDIESITRRVIIFVKNHDFMADKLFSMSVVSGRRVKPNVEFDTVERSKLKGNRRGLAILYQVQDYWNNMETFRKERERTRRYVYGDQLGDYIQVQGRLGCTTKMRESDYIRSQGSEPLQNNHMWSVMRSMLGVFRSQNKEPFCSARDRDEQELSETMSTVLQCVMQKNRMNEVKPRSFEEFLISGFVVHRMSYEWRNENNDCWIDYVNPNYFFIDDGVRDFRGWDVNCIGEIHDITFEELCSQFAKSSDDARYLKEIYKSARTREQISYSMRQFGNFDLKRLDFLFAEDTNKCRVIEVWRKEQKPRFRCHDLNTGEYFKVDEADYQELVVSVNEQRIAQGTSAGMAEDDIPLIEAEAFLDSYWYYYFITPLGYILDEGETPYAHKSHPYVFKAYPFIDGVIKSFMGGFIDQQRYVNRLITLFDWLIRATAKGVLMIPTDCIPEGVSMKRFASEWRKFNGVVFYKPGKSGRIPQQVANNSTNIGINEILSLQLKFFENVSGVTGAIQGKQAQSGTSGTLYAQQTNNAAVSLSDVFESFNNFIIDGAYKTVKNIQQYYDSKLIINIAGRRGAQVEYDPEKMQDVEYDLSIEDSASSPVYRQLANDFLMEIWRSGQISLEQLLENGNFPFADSLLQSIKSQQEQIANGQQPQGLPPQLQQQIQQGTNMQAVQQGAQALYG